MGKLLFIFNPAAGNKKLKAQVPDIIDTLVKAGYDVETYPTQGREDASARVKRNGADFDMIVCGGGDGTLNEVVSGLMTLEKQERPVLGYIPAGTTNDFARSIGISTKPGSAADIIVNGHRATVDTGRFNGRDFVYVAAFGVFTGVSYETPADLKKILGHQAYVLEGVKEVPKIKSHHARITADGLLEEIEDDFIYGMVSNSNYVGGFKGITGRNIDLNDGMLEVTLVRSIKNVQELHDALSFLTGISDTSKTVISFKTANISFKLDEPAAWSVDGEYGGSLSEAVISDVPHSISIMRK